MKITVELRINGSAICVSEIEIKDHILYAMAEYHGNEALAEYISDECGTLYGQFTAGIEIIEPIVESIIKRKFND